MSPRVPKGESLHRVGLTIQDILTSSGKYPERPVKWPPTKEIVSHATVLTTRLNRLGDYWERQLTLSSGYRPPAVNALTKGAAKGSLHQLCCAADILDPNGELAKFVMGDLPMMEHIGLWVEDPFYTKGWLHVQIFPPRSGNRVFKP